MSLVKYIGFSLLLLSPVVATRAEHYDITYAKENYRPETSVSKKKLLKLVNDIRAKGCNCGSKYYPPAPPVSWNDQLEDAAIKHSRYMYKKQKMSHYGPNHNNPGDRIRAEKYSWNIYGENVAKGYQDEENVIKGWLGSGGHCKNIMNPAVIHMGVARVDDYWTQVFAHPL